LHLVQAVPFQTFFQTMKRTYDIVGTWPKWWRPEMLRTFLFITAYLDRRSDLVPAALVPDLNETLRLLPIMCEEFAKAAIAARNRMMRVRCPCSSACWSTLCLPSIHDVDVYMHQENYNSDSTALGE
jgi:hypothetical protein